MASKDAIVVCFLLFFVIGLCHSQSSSSNGVTSKKDCPKKRGYAWLSCLMVELSCNPKNCKRYKHTDLVKNITCKPNKSACGTCAPKFYLNDQEINCEPLELTGYDCPVGVRKAECTLNPCESTTCRDQKFLVADCKPNYCGGCFAEYFVDNRWQRCPVSVLDIQPDAMVVRSRQGMNSPRLAVAFGGRSALQDPPRVKQSVIDAPVCPSGQTAFECPASVCQNANCPAYPNAKCRIDNCGGCKAQWTHGIYVIKDCNSRECPVNTLEMVCNDDPCKYSTCLKHAHLNPVCRPSRCGGCKAQWSVNGKEVDCFEQYGEEVACPNGERRHRCKLNTCKFKKCPTDKEITCTIDNCGGCFPEYRNMSNHIVDCIGWWTPYERKRVRKIQNSASNTNKPAHSQSSGRVLDIPLLQPNTNPVVTPVVPSGGSVSINNESIDKMAVQRGLERALGIAARKEKTRQTKSNTIQKSPSSKSAVKGGHKDIPTSVPSKPSNTIGSSLNTRNRFDTSSSSSSVPSSSSSSTGRNRFGTSSSSSSVPSSSSSSTGRNRFGTSSSSSSVPSSSSSSTGRNRFSSNTQTDIRRDRFKSAPKSRDRFGPSSSSSNAPIQRERFGTSSNSVNRNRFGPSANSVNRVDSLSKSASKSSINVPVDVSKPDPKQQNLPLNEQPKLLVLPPPPPPPSQDNPARTKFDNNPSPSNSINLMSSSPKQTQQKVDVTNKRNVWNSNSNDPIQVNVPVANELSKKRKPKIVSDKRSPPKQNQKGLINHNRKSIMDSNNRQINTPSLPIVNLDASVVDRNIAKKVIKTTEPVPTAPPQTQNILFVIKDKGSEPTLLDWLLRGLLIGTDLTGMPIQAMGDHQPISS